ncbi:MAG: hypothetical protein ACD_8C00056G0021 [uncultured bacterium]|nr:MAG: hypothetical protein ACD_8C00056G0021 [uncultured bacterium]
MLSISKQDIIKTLIIIWFIATTGYVAYDQYFEYKVNGLKASYEQGYMDSISKLIVEVEKNSCQGVDITKEDKKIQIVNAQCLQQVQTANETQATQGTTKK